MKRRKQRSVECVVHEAQAGWQGGRDRCGKAHGDRSVPYRGLERGKQGEKNGAGEVVHWKTYKMSIF
jgi:hypothetical protein